MRKFLFVMLLAFLAGCASAPKPPECKGEFRPVNLDVRKDTAAIQTQKIVKCNEGISYGNKG